MAVEAVIFPFLAEEGHYISAEVLYPYPSEGIVEVAVVKRVGNA